MEQITVNWWKVGLIGLVALLLMGLSFYAGRATCKTKVVTEIKYIKGDTIRDTIYSPKPYKVIEPVDTMKIIEQCVKDGIYQELFPTKVVTEYVTVSKEDTTAIMQDWATVREYKETLFDIDTVGTCNIDAEVQYNRLKSIDYSFTPVIKEVTNTEIKIKKYMPFIGAGISTMPSVDAMAGLIYNQSWGFAIDGSYYYNPSKIENMPKWSVGIKAVKVF